MESVALVGEVRGVPELTFYARHGDIFAWSAALLTALATLLAAFVRVRDVE